MKVGQYLAKSIDVSPYFLTHGVYHHRIIMSMTYSSLSVGVFSFDEIAAFNWNSGKESFRLGVGVDRCRTAYGHIALDISTERSGGDSKVATEGQVATFGERFDGRLACENNHKVCHLKSAHISPRVTVNNASNCWTDGLYRTPNPHPSQFIC